jgi:hypothetical protein
MPAEVLRFCDDDISDASDTEDPVNAKLEEIIPHIVRSQMMHLPSIIQIQMSESSSTTIIIIVQ